MVGWKILNRLLVVQDNFALKQFLLKGEIVHLHVPIPLLGHRYQPSQQSSLFLIWFQVADSDEQTMDFWGQVCDSISRSMSSSRQSG
eukprot:9997558-Prorocentrum_lima.AAC.1